MQWFLFFLFISSDWVFHSFYVKIFTGIWISQLKMIFSRKSVFHQNIFHSLEAEQRKNLSEKSMLICILILCIRINKKKKTQNFVKEKQLFARCCLHQHKQNLFMTFDNLFLSVSFSFFFHTFSVWWFILCYS